MPKSNTGKKIRKAGRNKIYCTIYRNSWRQEANQLRRLKKHIGRHPNDLVAGVAATRCRTILGHSADLKKGRENE